MNKKITERFDRARIYLDRIRIAIKDRNPAQGMADASELGFQAHALYAEFAEVVHQKQKKFDGNKP